MNMQYIGMPLDRCDALRRDAQTMLQCWHDQQTLLVPVWQNKNLFQVDSVQQAASPPVLAGMSAEARLFSRADVGAEVRAIIERAAHPVFLGQKGGINYVAIDVNDADQPLLCEALGAAFIDLRTVGAALPVATAALLAYARGLMFWREQHRFCSRCGSGLSASHGGHVLKCNAAACGRETYPRTDPAVIMLIERSGPGGVKQCLLGRHANWVPGSFATLAGFVEPGESLEEAVRREVLEESGVSVGAVRYIASQPWPFPASIMLGFIGEAVASEIVTDPHELAEAYWFSREELRGFGDWGNEASAHNLPRKDSISRFLIDYWLEAGE